MPWETFRRGRRTTVNYSCNCIIVMLPLFSRQLYIFRAGVAPTSARTEFNADPVSRWHVAKGDLRLWSYLHLVFLSLIFQVSAETGYALWCRRQQRWQVSIASAHVSESAKCHFALSHKEVFDQKDVNVRESFDRSEKQRSDNNTHLVITIDSIYVLIS